MAFFVVTPAVVTYYGAAALGTAIAGGLGITGLSAAATFAIGAGTISAGFTALRGGDAEDILKSAVLSGATSYIGGTIGKDIASNVRAEAIMNGDLSFNAANAVGKIAGSTAVGAINAGLFAAVGDKDPIDAFIQGGLSTAMSSTVSAGVDAALADVPGFAPTQDAAQSAFQRATKAALGTAILSGGDMERIEGAVLNSFINSAGFTVGDKLFDQSDNVRAVNEDFKASEQAYTSNIEQQQQLAAQYDSLLAPAQDLYKVVEAEKSEYETAINDYNSKVDQYGTGYSYLVSQGGTSHRSRTWGMRFVRMPDGSIIDTKEYANNLRNTANTAVNEYQNAINNYNDKYTELFGGEVTKYRTETVTKYAGNYDSDGNYYETPYTEQVQVPYKENVAGILTGIKEQVETLQNEEKNLASVFEQNKQSLTTALKDFQETEAKNAEVVKSKLDNFIAASDQYKTAFGQDPSEDLLMQWANSENMLDAVNDYIAKQQTAQAPVIDDSVTAPGAENIVDLVSGPSAQVAQFGDPNADLAVIDALSSNDQNLTNVVTAPDGSQLVYDQDNNLIDIIQAPDQSNVDNALFPGGDGSEVESGISTDTLLPADSIYTGDDKTLLDTSTTTAPDGSQLVYDQDGNLIDVIPAPDQSDVDYTLLPGGDGSEVESGISTDTSLPETDVITTPDGTTTTAKGNIVIGGGTPTTAPSSGIMPSISPLSSASTSSTDTTQGALPVALNPSLLQAAPITEGAPLAMQELPQLFPQLTNIDPRLMQVLAGRSSVKPGYYNYGQQVNAQSPLLGASISGLPSAGIPVRATSNAYSPLSAGVMSGNPRDLMSAGMNMLGGGGGGGGLSGYATGGGVESHNPKFITGKTGHYVRGEGDGQSDSIPAMLADGEYVFDADTVAALGNGSNEAGARVLDKMRENIRKHKRSAKHGDIPPPAKSPLAYMKG